MSTKLLISSKEIDIILHRLACQLIEKHLDFKNTKLIGLQPRGISFAKRLTKILQEDYKVKPERMVAAGRSYYTPLETNKTLEGRAKNRRTRIVLMPKLDQFFELLEQKVD